MDKIALNELADRIEKLPHAYGDVLPAGDSFSMLRWEWKPDCRTICCIGGWIEEWNSRVQGNDFVRSGNAVETLLKYGVDERQIGLLFYPVGSVNTWAAITPQRAANVIRNLAETGEVVW